MNKKLSEYDKLKLSDINNLVDTFESLLGLDAGKYAASGIVVQLTDLEGRNLSKVMIIGDYLAKVQVGLMGAIESTIKDKKLHMDYAFKKSERLSEDFHKIVKN